MLLAPRTSFPCLLALRRDSKALRHYPKSHFQVSTPRLSFNSILRVKSWHWKVNGISSLGFRSSKASPYIINPEYHSFIIILIQNNLSGRGNKAHKLLSCYFHVLYCSHTWMIHVVGTRHAQNRGEENTKTKGRKKLHIWYFRLLSKCWGKKTIRGIQQAVIWEVSGLAWRQEMKNRSSQIFRHTGSFFSEMSPEEYKEYSQSIVKFSSATQSRVPPQADKDTLSEWVTGLIKKQIIPMAIRQMVVMTIRLLSSGGITMRLHRAGAAVWLHTAVISELSSGTWGWKTKRTVTEFEESTHRGGTANTSRQERVAGMAWWGQETAAEWYRQILSQTKIKKGCLTPRKEDSIWRCFETLWEECYKGTGFVHLFLDR